MSRPRLLVLTSTFPRWIGDHEPRFVLDLCQQLQRWTEVEVLAPHHAGASTCETIEGVPVYRFRYAPQRLETLAYAGGMLSRLKANRFRLLLAIPYIAAMLLSTLRLLRNRDLDAIHAHWIIPQGLIAALARRLRWLIGRPSPRLVCTSHGGDLYGLRGQWWQWVKQKVLSACDEVTVVSRAMLDSLPDGIQASVIPMGTDLHHRFVPDHNATRNEHELLFVGRLVEKKGLDILLAAMPAIITKHPQTSLTIAGDGPARQALKSQAHGLGISANVRFLGSLDQDELPRLYRRAALAVFPFVVADNGDQEGLGLVVVEAQGCGCPVLASDIAPVRDTIIDGETGWLVPPADGDAIAMAVSRIFDLTESERSRVVTDARTRAVDSFDWNHIGARYGRLLLGNE